MLTRMIAVMVLLVTLVPSAAFAASPRSLSLLSAPSFDAPLLLVVEWPVCAILAWFASQMLGRLFASLLSMGTL